MKRSLFFLGIFLCSAIIMIGASPSHAETAKKYNIGVGGYFGIGGATTFFDDRDGAFALGIQPEAQFFVIDNLSITYRFLWERIFYDVRYWTGTRWKVYSSPMDIAPFLFGARYYFPIMDRLKVYTGMGIGFTAYRVDIDDGRDTLSRFAFAMDFYGGVEYEVIDNLAVGGMFNIMLPNLGPLDHDELVVGRFMFFFGATYYIPLNL
ncbi:MAG TPA: outer membrane beta-barrel protein [Spirochaetota bacterium]|nr:outer membrane beta-barrel protein [Spirochaetota bacterium]HPI89952.1 outer membrane beta-barrel protein [Spirochaetota bacterium]HPR48449.1 outer membrane beta-barrel protein [Spirochaetota bacterium]